MKSFHLPLLALASSELCRAIILGRDAHPHEIPSMASLISSGIFGNNHICGATIISPTACLTSASCCDGSSASSLKVRVGSNNRNTGGSILQVTRIIKHPNWNTNTIDSNYCLLRTGVIPIQEGLVEIAPLPSMHTPTDQSSISVSGWGKTDKAANALPIQLQTANFTIIDKEGCHSIWEDINPITKNMLCFKGPGDGKASVCDADMGGPVLRPSDGTVLGVISHAKDCFSARPNVAADVLSALDWIESNL